MGLSIRSLPQSPGNIHARAEQQGAVTPTSSKPIREIEARMDQLKTALESAYQTHAGTNKAGSRAPTAEEVRDSCFREHPPVRGQRELMATVFFKDGRTAAPRTWGVKGSAEVIAKMAADAAELADLKAELERRPARLSNMPTELLVKILDHVPNGEGNRVTSLARTSHSLYALDLRKKSQAKAKSSDLIDRAKRIGKGGDFEERLAEFISILNGAIDPRLPLHGKDLTDVLIALAVGARRLGHYQADGISRLLKIVERLGGAWNKVTARDPDERKEEMHRLDRSRLEILHALLSKKRLQFPYNVIGYDAIGGYGVIGKLFDKLCGVLASIKSPEVINKAVADLENLGEWHLPDPIPDESVWNRVWNREWVPNPTGAERFGKLLQFVENNLTILTDNAKAKAVINLLPLIRHHGKANWAADIHRLCGIIETIKDGEARGDAVAGLIDFLPKPWVDFSPDPWDEAKILATHRIYDALSTIEDQDRRARLHQQFRRSWGYMTPPRSSIPRNDPLQ